MKSWPLSARIFRNPREIAFARQGLDDMLRKNWNRDCGDELLGSFRHSFDVARHRNTGRAANRGRADRGIFIHVVYVNQPGLGDD